MAGKNAFRSLQQFGTKELKFKQGVHIEAAYKGNVLSAPIYNSAKAGVCAALTMEWLKANLSDGQYNPPFISARIPAAQNRPHQALVLHASPFQKTYMKSSKKYDDKLKQLALEYGLDLRPDNTAPAHFGQVFDSAADRTIRGRIGVYCSCETKDSEGKEASHAIGIVKSLEGTIRFFDCNVGAYKFESQFKFTEFYEHWGMLYRTKLELDIGTRCWGYLVGDISGVRPAKPEGATRRSLAQLGWATTRQ